MGSRIRSLATAAVLAVGAALAAAPAAGEDRPWQPPADGVVAEARADAFLSYLEAVVKLQARAAGEAKAAPDDPADKAARARREERLAELKKANEAALAAAGLDRKEAEWIADRFLRIHKALEVLKELGGRTAARTKALDERAAATEKTRAEIADARKNGGEEADLAKREDAVRKELATIARERAAVESTARQAREEAETVLASQPAANVELVKARTERYRACLTALLEPVRSKKR